MFKSFVAIFIIAQISIFADEVKNIQEIEDRCYEKQEQCVSNCEKLDGDISPCLDQCDEKLNKCLPKES